MHKGREVEDYKKAAWYLDKLIGVLKSEKYTLNAQRQGGFGSTGVN